MSVPKATCDTCSRSLDYIRWRWNLADCRCVQWRTPENVAWSANCCCLFRKSLSLNLMAMCELFWNLIIAVFCACAGLQIWEKHWSMPTDCRNIHINPGKFIKSSITQLCVAAVCWNSILWCIIGVVVKALNDWRKVGRLRLQCNGIATFSSLKNVDNFESLP